MCVFVARVRRARVLELQGHFRLSLLDVMFVMMVEQFNQSPAMTFEGRKAEELVLRVAVELSAEVIADKLKNPTKYEGPG